jgi:endonuclease/exonuclease/phosphatase family metal-dependent hydrolase
VLSHVFVSAESSSDDAGMFLSWVTLHLDSGINAGSVAARKSQLDQLRAFLEQELRNDADSHRPWPIIIAGDFNVPHVGPSATAPNLEYVDARERLKLHCSDIPRA